MRQFQRFRRFGQVQRLRVASKADDSSKDDSSDSAGFEEIQVDEKHSDQECGPLTVNAVYFQPIDMEPSGMGLKAADASFHLEADIHANEKGTELGYGKGDFVPDLTVNYEIINNANNETVGSGTFMQMNASDGPHYGANVKLDEAGSYKLVLKIESAGEEGGCCMLIRRPALRAASGPNRSRSLSRSGTTPPQEW